MRRSSSIATLVALFTLSASADVISTFTNGAEGWRVAGPDPGSHIGSQPLSSNPITWTNGFVTVGDNFGWTWAMAPAQFLGNQSDAYAKQMSWDILIRFSDGVSYPAVALQGATFTLYFVTPSPPLNAWTHRTANLSGGDWRVNNYTSGALASQQQIQEVLSDLRGLFILTEWNTGSDSTDLDNVAWPGSASCDGDLNGDAAVDDSDFVLFVAAYNLLDCLDPSMPAGCPADFNNDGAVDDGDFVIFVVAYNDLLCP